MTCCCRQNNAGEFILLTENHTKKQLSGAQVVTVPAHFGDVRRKATHRAARLAGLQAVHLLQGELLLCCPLLVHSLISL